MTKEQFLAKVEELIPQVNDLIRNKANTLTNSGAVDFESYDDDFLLAKIFMSAMGEEIKYQFKPLSKDALKERNNMIHFL